MEPSLAFPAAVKIAAPARRAAAIPYPHRFSGGMRQRLMIAMGLSGVPDLPIADEPTTALAVTIEAQFMELLSTEVERRPTVVADHP